MTAPNPDPSTQNIGLFYKVLGAASLVGAIVLGILDGRSTKTLGWADFSILGILVILCLALIRPALFDNLVKLGLSKLPFGKSGDTSK